MPVNVSFFQPGRDYEFLYPRHNFRAVLSALETRRVRVVKVRDIALDPLEEQTATIQPLLRRGRYIITGQDLDKCAERSFYMESMREVRPI